MKVQVTYSCWVCFDYMGGCQNYAPFLGTLNIRCRIIIGTQKGIIILTTTHIVLFSSKKHSTSQLRLEGRVGRENPTKQRKACTICRL